MKEKFDLAVRCKCVVKHTSKGSRRKFDWGSTVVLMKGFRKPYMLFNNCHI